MRAPHTIYLDIDSASGQIGTAIEAWLFEEAISSGEDHNEYLDNLAVQRENLVRAADDNANHSSAKHRSHHDRQRTWGTDLIADPNDEYLAARQVFNPLMQMSGIFRRICYLQAVDQSDYERLRKTPNSTGIDTRAAVASRLLLRSMSNHGTEATLTVPGAISIHAETLAAFEGSLRDLHNIAKRASRDFGKVKSPSVSRLQAAQKVWCGVVTDSILMAAGYREGDLASVPFLEPKSITHKHQIKYPLRITT
jgi:hypothetical protein